MIQFSSCGRESQLCRWKVAGVSPGWDVPRAVAGGQQLPGRGAAGAAHWLQQLSGE